MGAKTDTFADVGIAWDRTHSDHSLVIPLSLGSPPLTTTTRLPMDYLQCFNDRNLRENVFGESLEGVALNGQWMKDGPQAYYTYFCMILAISFFGIGFAPSIRKLYNPHFQIWITLFAWTLSIIIVYIGYILGGVTWVVLSLGLLHNASESLISFLLIQINRNATPEMWKSKTSALIFLPFLTFWLAEVIWTFSVDLVGAYIAVASMGAFLDTSAFILWIVTHVRGKSSIWPVIAFAFHEVYVFGIIFNCFFVPWGRFLGLFVNMLAIGFITIPAQWQTILRAIDSDEIELEEREIR